MPEVAAAADASPPAQPKPKSKKRRLLGAVIALAVLAGASGGVGYFLYARHAGPKAPRMTAEAGYDDLGSIVANFTTDHAIHFLQVDVVLVSHDPQALATARQVAPHLRNALVLLLSAQKYATLASAKGKLQLQQEALRDVQGIVRQSLGRPGIQAVYFTSFVMQ